MKRKYKGEPRNEYLKDFCSVDVETTGLDPRYNHIIEIGATRYRDGKPVRKFQSLVRPPRNKYGQYVTGYISSFTHITNNMLLSSPPAEYVIPKFENFLGSDVIVGYNVNFDINFLYDIFMKVLKKPLKNDYIDVLVYSRRYLPQLEHHTLTDTISYFNIVNSNAHRAFHDSYVTGQAYIKFCEMIKVDG